MTTEFKGLKVIVAEGECQLERQRRLKPIVAKNLSAGVRTVRVKYGVDEDTCTGDHSCIRLSGCPTLTVKDNPDPLRRDPVATVIDGCVGCGLCGENAHAAVLCPSFYRAEVIQNPGLFDRFIVRLRRSISYEPARASDHHPHRSARRRRRRRDGRLADGGGHRFRLSRRRRPRSPASRSAPAPPPTTSRSFRAERTGWAASEPVLSLTPSPGNVDVMVASELVEAGRAMQNGYVSPERTTLIASTHRIYATVEKMQMGDGRFDSDKVVAAGKQLAKTRGAVRHAQAGAGQRHGDQRGAVRRDGRQRRAAAAARGLRGGDPRRRPRRRGQPARLRRRLRHRRRLARGAQAAGPAAPRQRAARRDAPRRRAAAGLPGRRATPRFTRSA